MLVGRVSYRAEELATESQKAALSGFTTDTWALFDPDTGEILRGENLDEVRPIASITKLFTAYAATKSDLLDSAVTISWSDLNTEGRAGKLTYGERHTVRELLFPLLIESSNDAGEALRRALGNDFALELDILERELGLASTVIVDGSGLSPENVSTVADLSRFYSFLRREHPHILDITKLKLYIGEEHGWVNNDPARELPGFSGGKNGYTYEAGRTFVGTFTIPETDREVGVVFLGSTNFSSDMNLLMDYLENAY